MLNPYVNDIDPMNISTGNPALDPERSYGVSANFSRRLKPDPVSRVGIGVSYSRITGAIERISSTDRTGVTLSTYDNVGLRDKFAVSMQFILAIDVWNGMYIFSDVRYSIINYDGRYAEIGNNRVSGFAAISTVDVRPWKTGTLNITHILKSNLEYAQSRKIEYYNDFKFEFGQTLVRNKLFATVAVRNPFQSHDYVRNVIGGSNFMMNSSRERLGRVFEFTLRGNFGRLKERVAQAEKIADDTARE